MMQKNTGQASLPNVANKPKFSTLNQQLKGAGALKQGTGRATQSGKFNFHFDISSGVRAMT
jgi:hypothetical protein